MKSGGAIFSTVCAILVLWMSSFLVPTTTPAYSFGGGGQTASVNVHDPRATGGVSQDQQPNKQGPSKDESVRTGIIGNISEVNNALGIACYASVAGSNPETPETIQTTYVLTAQDSLGTSFVIPVEWITQCRGVFGTFAMKLSPGTYSFSLEDTQDSTLCHPEIARTYPGPLPSTCNPNLPARLEVLAGRVSELEIYVSYSFRSAGSSP